MSERAFKVCEHAVERYCERDLSGPVFVCAARFGAQVVRRPGVFRAVLQFTPVAVTVITVLPDENLPAQLRPVSLGGFPWLCDQMAEMGCAA